MESYFWIIVLFVIILLIAIIYQLQDVCRKKYFWIIVLYIFATILWIVLIYYLQIAFRDPFDYFIFCIPIFVFAIAIGNLGKPLSKENEIFIFNQNYASSFSVILMPILIYIAQERFDRKLLLIVLFSVGFGLIAFLDLWVSNEDFDISKHFKSIFQTISIVLIIFSLKLFFFHTLESKENILLT